MFNLLKRASGGRLARQPVDESLAVVTASKAALAILPMSRRVGECAASHFVWDEKRICRMLRRIMLHSREYP